MELGFDKSCEVQRGGFQPGKQMDLNSADDSSSYGGVSWFILITTLTLFTLGGQHLLFLTL